MTYQQDLLKHYREVRDRLFPVPVGKTTFQLPAGKTLRWENLRACREIFLFVATQEGILPEQLLKCGRQTKRIANARAIAAHMCITMTGVSFSDLARMVRRHHTTMLYAVRRVETSTVLLERATIYKRLFTVK